MLSPSLRLGVAFEMEVGPGDLLKHDLEIRVTTVHDVGPKGAASEGVFVSVGPARMTAMS